MYNSPEQAISQLKQAGHDLFAEELLAELSKPVIVPYTRDITFDDPQAARRLFRLLYDLMSNYPEHKPKITFRLNDCTVKVKITDREERRGRKPKRSGTV